MAIIEKIDGADSVVGSSRAKALQMAQDFINRAYDAAGAKNSGADIGSQPAPQQALAENEQINSDQALAEDSSMSADQASSGDNAMDAQDNQQFMDMIAAQALGAGKGGNQAGGASKADGNNAGDDLAKLLEDKNKNGMPDFIEKILSKLLGPEQMKQLLDALKAAQGVGQGDGAPQGAGGSPAAGGAGGGGAPQGADSAPGAQDAAEAQDAQDSNDASDVGAQDAANAHDLQGSEDAAEAQDAQGSEDAANAQDAQGAEDDANPLGDKNHNGIPDFIEKILSQILGPEKMKELLDALKPAQGGGDHGGGASQGVGGPQGGSGCGAGGGSGGVPQGTGGGTGGPQGTGGGGATQGTGGDYGGPQGKGGTDTPNGAGDGSQRPFNPEKSNDKYPGTTPPDGGVKPDKSNPGSTSTDKISPLSPTGAMSKDLSVKNIAAKHGMYAGVAVDMNQLQDPRYQKAIKDQANVITAENHMKWGELEKNGYGPADKLVDWADKNDIKVRGHALMWHEQAPDRIKNMSGDQLKEETGKHINKTMKHFGDKVPTWDVVNETFSDQAAQSKANGKGGFRDSSTDAKGSPFNEKIGGQKFLDHAFTEARKASPKAELVLNDYDVETKNAKSDAMYEAVKSMKERGIPIDAVGFQAHVKAGQDLSSMAENIKRFKDLGVKVQITELDVAGGSREDKIKTEKAVFDAAAKGGASGVTFWGVSDAHSWIGNDPGLVMDKDMKVKEDLLKALNG